MTEKLHVFALSETSYDCYNFFQSSHGPQYTHQMIKRTSDDNLSTENGCKYAKWLTADRLNIPFIELYKNL